MGHRRAAATCLKIQSASAGSNSQPALEARSSYCFRCCSCPFQEWHQWSIPVHLALCDSSRRDRRLTDAGARRATPARFAGPCGLVSGRRETVALLCCMLPGCPTNGQLLAKSCRGRPSQNHPMQTIEQILEATAIRLEADSECFD
jgi:hypothetical protein